MMRADLNKLLCERERRRSSYSHHDYRKKISGKKREGIKFRYGYERKNFNENLNPLYKWVNKQVGRPWDNVYSELCQQFDKRSVINQHILGHLYQHVELHVQEHEGELYINPQYSWLGSRTLLKDSSTELYVDPRDGILKDNKGPLRRRARFKALALEQKREREKTQRVIGPNLEARRVADGPWFICTMRDVPCWITITSKNQEGDLIYTKVRGSARDVFENKTVEWPTPKYAISKRTANKKELRDYGLAS